MTSPSCPANVWSVFAELAPAIPDHPAIIRADQALTFSQLHRRALQYAVALARLGLRRNDRVILWMNAGPDMGAAILATWAMGGIAALMGPREPVSHLRHAIQAVSPRLIIVGEDAPLPGPVEIAVLSETEVDTDPADAAPCPALPTDPASIVFTSGSTGRPKGVTQPHRNLVHACRTVAGYLGYQPDDRIVCTIPWSFDYGYGQFLSTVVGGITQIVPTRLDPIAMCEAIQSHKPTVLPIISAVITYLLQGLSPFRSIDTSSIRIVTNTGGALPGAILSQLLDLLPQARVFLNFGLTESYRTSCLDPSLVREKPTSIGKPIPGVDIILVREDGSIIEGAGEIGQLVHRGDFLFMGYWNNPDATAKALRPDPLADPDCPDPRPVLYTGDLATRDDEGFYYHIGRIDHQIKSMGVRVSPSEVEELLHASGLVREVGVFGLPHEMLGHEVWAAVVRHESFQGEDIAVELTSYSRTTMSPYMMPRRYLVMDGPLPKTRTGKVDYPALRERAQRESSSPDAV